MADTYTVNDDGVSPVETLPVVITKTIEQNEQMSLNDVISEINSIVGQVNNLNARKTELEAIKASIQTALDALPPRPNDSDDDGG